MEAIKKILSPGNAKDNEIMYGDASAPNTSIKDDGTGAYKAGVPTGDNAPTLHALPAAEKKEHGILNQVLNPGGEKYDAARYGGTATTSASAAEQARADDAPAEKEHGVLRQILNPGGDKYDAQQYGTPSQGDTTTTASHGVTGTHAPASSTTAPSTTAAQSYESTTGPTSHSHAGRDAVLGGAAGAGAGALASDAARHHGAESTTTGQSQPGYSGTNAPQYSSTGTSAAYPTTTGSQFSSNQHSSSVPAAVSHHHPGPSDNGLSHHVHNGVTDIPVRRSHDHSVASASALRGAGNSDTQDSTPVSHISLAAPPTTGHDDGLSHKVYNTVVGKHSEHEHDPAYPQYSSSSHGTTAVGPSGHSTTSGVTNPAATTYGTTGAQSQNLPIHSSTAQTTAAGLVGGSAAAIAAQHAAQRHNTQAAGFGAGQTSTPSTSTARGTTQADTGYGTGTSSSSTTTGPHSSNLLNKLDPRVKTDTTEQRPHEHHQGRDAAVAGGLGGAAIGAHEGRHHDNTASSSANANTNTSTTTPHSSNLLNKLDPRVDTKAQEHDSHHHGRDTAAAAGLGTAGVGAYEADKHRHHQQQQQQYSTNPSSTLTAQTTTSTTTSTTTTGPHSSNILNKLDPRVSSDATKPTQGDHHYGRDAALAGGAGAAGAGIYEAGKHHGHDTTSGAPYQQTSTGAQPTSSQYAPTSTTGQPTTTTTGVSGKDALMTSLGATPQTQQQQQHTHVGRDAALVGGTGAAAYGAEKHHHDHAGTTSTPSDNTQKPGLLTKLGLKSDPNEKSSKLQRQSGQDSHAARDATITGGAAATTGVGAYEAEKLHHHHHDISTPATTAGASTTNTASETHKPGLLQKLGLKQDTSTGNTATGTTAGTAAPEHQTHHGRDAALVGGTGAVAGAGVYEAEKHHHKHDSTAAAASTTPAATTTSHGHHDATASHSHGHHHDSKHLEKENKPGLFEKLGLKQDKSHEPYEKESHKGRDAALVGGAGAATGAGVYEANKHHHHQQEQALPASTSQQHSTTHDRSSTGHHTHHSHDKHVEHEQKPGLLTKLGLKKDKTDETVAHDTHHGRDAAIAGGTGAAVGAGAYEANKHHDGTTHHSGTSNPAYHHSVGQSAGPGLVEATGASTGTGHATHDPYAQRDVHNQSAYTGATSGTTAPHDSNVANTLDPRVHNDPAASQHDRTFGSTTHGTHDHTASGLATGAAAGAGAGALAHESREGHSNIEKRHGIAVSADERQHNKLHKEPKEPGFISKLLHGKSDKHDGQSSATHGHDHHHGKDAAAVGAASTTAGASADAGHGTGREIDPHTGLPINTTLGTGAGGTDGSTNITGYHQDPNVQPANWQQIGKDNTPY